MNEECKTQGINAIKEPLLEEYFEKLKLSGVNVSSQKHIFTLFFNYLKDRGIEYLSLNINTAQDFQSRLMSLTDSTGGMHYTKDSVITMMRRLKRFYQYLKQRKLILSNPFSETQKIKASYKLPKNILDESSVSKLLNCMKEFWKPEDIREQKRFYKVHVISELMYSAGLRMHEVRNLKISDIDLDSGMVRVSDSKTKTERSAILNEYTCKVLKIYIEKMRNYIIAKNTSYSDLLFGSNVSVYTMTNKALKDICKKLGLKKITSHGFRHCLGYHLLRAGCDIRYIQAILGHRSLDSTQIYTKVDKKDLKNILDKYHPRKLNHKEDKQ